MQVAEVMLVKEVFRQLKKTGQTYRFYCGMPALTVLLSCYHLS